LSTKSELTTSIVTRSKLEHYGFNTLVRPASSRLSKRQPLAIQQNQNNNKKIRSNESRHSMQTRSQSSSVCSE